MACVICFLSSANMNLVVISLNHCDTDIGDTCNLLLQSLQNDCVTTCSSIFNFTACRSVNTFLNCLSDCISQFSSSQIVESRVNVLFFFQRSHRHLNEISNNNNWLQQFDNFIKVYAIENINVGQIFFHVCQDILL